MYAPVVTRLKTYGVTLGQEAEDYMTSVLDQSDMKDWVEQARVEPYTIDV